MTKQPNGLAPASGPRGTVFGARGGKTSQGWQYIWNRLSSTEWQEGQKLTIEAAEAVDIKPVSLDSVLHRMTREGHLEREIREVASVVTRAGGTFTSRRKRAFYRIKAKS